MHEESKTQDKDERPEAPERRRGPCSRDRCQKWQNQRRDQKCLNMIKSEDRDDHGNAQNDLRPRIEPVKNRVSVTVAPE